jgi:glycosyltransferase involved in cell wall biosynthesis
MLGWEYPPHISGGLGTACEGLTRSLARQNIDIIFVVPHIFGGERAEHMHLCGSTDPLKISTHPQELLEMIEGLDIQRIPSFLLPYSNPKAFSTWIESLAAQLSDQAIAFGLSYFASLSSGARRELKDDRYSGDIFTEVARFAADVLLRFSGAKVDLIHAHDWMTFPAALALKKALNVPLFLHVHSLEFDRSGGGANQQIAEIERFALQAADQVIAVSYYTRSLINRLYGVALDKIEVVHNGVYSSELVRTYRKERNWGSRVVLFLGRITFQKGPDYFVEAAAKVLPHVPDALFVMAGSGDMLPQIQRRISELGIEKHFYFPGFVRGAEVEQMFSLADVYVMPSVSEPFGISALEAISYNTPVIISRQSGVAEVLKHALKVDFWDIQKLADRIINALIHAELREDIVAMAREELKRLHWDAAAQKCIEVYRSAV